MKSRDKEMVFYEQCMLKAELPGAELMEEAQRRFSSHSWKIFRLQRLTVKHR